MLHATCPKGIQKPRKTYSNKLFSQTCLLMINPRTTMGPRQAQDNHGPPQKLQAESY